MPRVAWLYADDLQLHPTDRSRVAELRISRPVRDARYPLPQQHGGADATEFFEGAVVSLAGSAWGTTDAEVHDGWRDILAAFPPGRDVVLSWLESGAPQSSRMVVRLAGPVDEESRQAPWWDYGLELFAPDPRIYSTVLSSASYDPVAAGADVGLLFPLEFPLTFLGAGAADGVLEVTNGGTFDTPPTFVIDGPVTNPVVQNETTGASIYTTGLALLDGEQLWLDVAARQARLGGAGGTLRADLIDPTTTVWGALAAGPNRLRLLGSDMVEGQTQLTVTWRDARL